MISKIGTSWSLHLKVPTWSDQTKNVDGQGLNFEKYGEWHRYGFLPLLYLHSSSLQCAGTIAFNSVTTKRDLFAPNF